MKTCTRCKQAQELSEFRPRKLISGIGLTSHCRSCHAETNKKYRRENRTQNVERKKSWYYADKLKNPTKGSNAALLRKYGITLAQKEAMWLGQNKCCAICEKNLPTLFKAKVDHRHVTGKVRKLLCARCNAHLGYIKESFDVALRLAKYIQEHNEVI